jgi:hypothetical protein
MGKRGFSGGFVQKRGAYGCQIGGVRVSMNIARVHIVLFSCSLAQNVHKGS